MGFFRELAGRISWEVEGQIYTKYPWLDIKDIVFKSEERKKEKA